MCEQDHREDTLIAIYQGVTTMSVVLAILTVRSLGLQGKKQG